MLIVKNLILKKLELKNVNKNILNSYFIHSRTKKKTNPCQMFNLRDFTIAWQKLAHFEFKGSNFKHFFIYSTQYNQRIQRIWKNLCKKDKVENQHWMLSKAALL